MYAINFCAIISNFDEVMPYYARLPSSPNMRKMTKTRQNARSDVCVSR